jgi:uncharacterized membrane protein
LQGAVGHEAIRTLAKTGLNFELPTAQVKPDETAPSAIGTRPAMEIEMNFQPLLDASPAIQIHAWTAVAALILGAIVLFRRKGDRLHRRGGRIWVGLMLVVTLSSFFIHEIRLWGQWSPIHLLSISTLLALVRAVAMIRRGNVTAHKRTMKATFGGALVIAGLFTFVPGRIMYEVVFAGGADAWLWLPPLFGLLAWFGWRRLRTHRPA